MTAAEPTSTLAGPPGLAGSLAPTPVEPVVVPDRVRRRIPVRIPARVPVRIPGRIPARVPVRIPVRIPVRRRVTVEHVLIAVAVAAGAVGVFLRFSAHSSLWLDEALTVDIARLSVPHLLTALRHDGSPPAYYLLLHVWMSAFGQSDIAVRTLPAVLSVATLPVAWALGRAIGGRQVALATTVLVATSPFAIRYGSETRMYALVMLLAAAGGLALVHCLREPTPRRLVSLGLLAGMLLLTHYWALYLVAATGGLLLLTSLVGDNRATARLTLAALGSGSLLFLPWAPSFLFQMAHTGTPWATAPTPMMIIVAVGEFAGWEHRLGVVLFVLYCVLLGFLLILVLLSTVPSARRLAALAGLRSQLPGERWAGPLAALGLGALVLAFVGNLASGAAFAYRYASIVFPAAMVLCALGATALGVTWAGPRTRAALIAAAALLGLPTGAAQAMANRTQASMVAATIRSVGHPGDVIVYCPDQLGPAVSRLLPNRFVQVTFPRFDPPQRIDWVDYAKVNDVAPQPGVIARQLVDLAGPTHQVWLVWEQGYRTLGSDCENLRDSLVAIRPNFTEPVRSDGHRFYEHESLDRFSPS